MTESNVHSRLEAFSDGVFAFALTLLIIDVKAPSTGIRTSHDLWLALGALLPTVYAFLLSFGIVFITWVNHHGFVTRVDKSSAQFVYANGFLLLTIVIIPFPTSLLGENLLTDHAAPAVVLYSANYALQAVAWWLLSRATRKPKSLARDEPAAEKLRTAGRDAVPAFVFYTTCAILAVWWPLPMAVVITVAWIVWLLYSINLKKE